MSNYIKTFDKDVCLKQTTSPDINILFWLYWFLLIVIGGFLCLPGIPEKIIEFYYVSYIFSIVIITSIKILDYKKEIKRLEELKNSLTIDKTKIIEVKANTFSEFNAQSWTDKTNNKKYYYLDWSFYNEDTKISNTLETTQLLNEWLERDIKKANKNNIKLLTIDKEDKIIAIGLSLDGIGLYLQNDYFIKKINLFELQSCFFTLMIFISLPFPFTIVKLLGLGPGLFFMLFGLQYLFFKNKDEKLNKEIVKKVLDFLEEKNN